MKIQGRFLKDRSGFTIIELIIVIVIIVILAGVGIPAFSRFLPNYQLKSAALDIFSFMQSTKVEAVKNNSSRSMIFDTADKSFNKFDGSTVRLTDYGRGIDFGGGAATQNASGGTDFSGGVSYGSDTLTFNSRGTGSAGWVYLENENGTSYAIGTLSSGVIRIRKWKDSDWK